MQKILCVIILVVLSVAGCQANKGVIRIERVEVNFTIQPTIGTEFSPSK